VTTHGGGFRALSEGEVHVWYTPTAELSGASLEAQRTVLSREELVHGSRFVTEALRRDFAVARALVRTALSRYADVPPREWEFGRTDLGRPYVSSPRGSKLEFSVSHTNGLVCCAVAVARDVGVDAEWLERRGDLEEVARRSFAVSELADIASQPAALRRRRTLELWTLKEAYAKARGVGLSLPFHRFAFDVAGADVRVVFSPDVGDDPRRWCFSRSTPTPVHVMAVAAMRQDGPVRFRACPMVPVHE
jgi:4'-phosphopantetheinyl transferase